MKELLLKYGCNPNQKPSRIYMENGEELPITVLNGNPGYINLLDALNGWQLVKELSESTGLPAAASFKHVSPSGAAVSSKLDDVLKKVYACENMEISPLASAYIAARGTDRMSSFGDFISLSHCCDRETAEFISKEVSDGIICPDYTEEAFRILSKKRKGNYTILKIDKNYVPKETEKKQVFGITFEQKRNNYFITDNDFNNIVTENKALTDSAVNDLKLALITLKYTQSNSVCYVKDGKTIGVGAGQQSRIHCTRLAGQKAINWHLRSHPKVLQLQFKDDIKRPDKDNAIDLYISDFSEELLQNKSWERLFKVKPELLTKEEKYEWIKKLNNVSLGSDAFFPFDDNIEFACKCGVKYIAQPGGSIRDQNVIDCCNKNGITMVFTGIRLFHH